MIKNVALKKFLKGTVFKGVSLVNKIIPKNDNIILLYMGNKGIGFNLRPLYNYLIENNYNKKYKIICSVEDKRYFEKSVDNVIFVNHIDAIKWYLMAGHVFYTAGQLPIKPCQRQIVIHMNHGITDYKTVGALTKIDNGDEFFFTYMIASAEIYKPIFAAEYLCPENNIVICGEPMVDKISTPKRKYDFKNYSKVLLWMPTFRQSDYLGYDDSTFNQILPLFDEEQYRMLNDYLSKYNCLIIAKIHPSQSLGNYKRGSYSHLQIYSNEDFVESGMDIYDLMAQVDGLIGDYSSASLQFLLTNKPLAYVIPDYDEYKNKRGFVFKNALDYMPGNHIYNVDEFFEFIDDIMRGYDKYQQERMRVKHIIHKYDDGKNCERILGISNIKI